MFRVDGDGDDDVGSFDDYSDDEDFGSQVFCSWDPTLLRLTLVGAFSRT